MRAADVLAAGAVDGAGRDAAEGEGLTHPLDEDRREIDDDVLATGLVQAGVVQHLSFRVSGKRSEGRDVGACAVVRSDRASGDHVEEVDYLQVVTGEIDREREGRIPVIGPQRDPDSLRKSARVGDGEDSGRLSGRRGEVHLEVGQQQRGGGKDADVATVVVVGGARRTGRKRGGMNGEGEEQQRDEKGQRSYSHYAV